MNRRIISVLLLVALFLTLTPFAFGTNSCSNCLWVLTEDSEGLMAIQNQETGEQISSAFGFNQAGELIEISLIAYLDMLNEREVSEIPFDTQRISPHFAAPQWDGVHGTIPVYPSNNEPPVEERSFLSWLRNIFVRQSQPVEDNSVVLTFYVPAGKTGAVYQTEVAGTANTFSVRF